MKKSSPVQKKIALLSQELPLPCLLSVGSRQGCSWGSFCYCLALHGPLSTLAGEFPDLLVLAYADDVHIVGPPARAVKAYNRWVELYESELQGNLRPDKSVCFAPSVPLEEVAAAGLPVKSLECPSGMPVVHDGTRVLGAPVGSLPFQAQFASERVAEICADLETICLMPTLQHQNCLATGSTVHRIFTFSGISRAASSTPSPRSLWRMAGRCSASLAAWRE